MIFQQTQNKANPRAVLFSVGQCQILFVVVASWCVVSLLLVSVVWVWDNWTMASAVE